MRNKYFSELIEFIKKKKPSKQKLAMRKMRLCRKYRIKDIPTDIEVMLNADAKDVPKIRRFLLTKPTRTISGVAAVAIMTKPRKCPH